MRWCSAGLDDTDGLQTAHVFLVTYDLLTRGDSLRQVISQRNPGLMIVDESHYCKNGDAKRTQVFQKARSCSPSSTIKMSNLMTGCSLFFFEM
jgi:hypothetical protein